jgi:hypothetical protein
MNLTRLIRLARLITRLTELITRFTRYVIAVVFIALVTIILFGGAAGWFRWELAIIFLAIVIALAATWVVRRRAPWLLAALEKPLRRLFRVSPAPPPPVLELNPEHVEEADKLVQGGRAALAREDRTMAYRYFSEAVERDFTNAAAWLGKGRTTRSPAERRICLERARRIDLARGFSSNHLPRWDVPIAKQIARGLTLRDLMPLHGLTIPPADHNGNNGAKDEQGHPGFRQVFKRWLR